MERILLLGRLACIRHSRGRPSGSTYHQWRICRRMGRTVPRVQGSSSLAKWHRGIKEWISRKPTFNLSLNVWETLSSLSMNLPTDTIPTKTQSELFLDTKARLSQTYRITKLQTGRWRKVKRFSQTQSQRWILVRRKEMSLRTKTLSLMKAAIMLQKIIKISQILCLLLLSRHWNR